MHIRLVRKKIQKREHEDYMRLRTIEQRSCSVWVEQDGACNVLDRGSSVWQEGKMQVVILIVALIIAIGIVNGGQQLLMRVLGADSMYYSMKTKLIIIGVVFLIIGSLMFRACGLS